MNRRNAQMQRKIKRNGQDLQNENFCSFADFHLRFSFLKISASLRLGGLILLFAFAVSAQDLPGEIRGYKVHKAKVSVQNSSDKTESKDEDLSVAVEFGKPKLVRVSPFGTTFEIFGEIAASEQSGKIDFLTFRDFRVNGLRVEIAEYKDSFQIEKNKPVRLKKPIRIFVPASQTVKGGLKEFFDSKEEWEITGRVFVFGRFKKLGFTFKRVVPFDADFKIKNPLDQKSVLPFPIRSN